uniref:CAS_CSE1 domain-containing protein n=1 Tax=Heterorhabditis bacteriophora TaxID=37862 RepID=A0A1I7XCR3_HETBA
MALNWLLLIAKGCPLFQALVSVTKSSKTMLSCTFIDSPITKCLVYITSGVLLNAAAARNSSIDQYVSFLPFLLSTQLWARSANIPAALSVLEVYLKICPEVVLRQHGELVMQHYVRLVGSKSLDQYGFQLAGSILPVIEMVNGVESPLGVLLNNMFRRVQFSKTPKFMKQFIVFLCRFAIIRGADILAKSIEAIQPGMFRMVVEKVVCNELSSLQNMTTIEDKRIIAIGISNVLANATNFIAEQYGSLAIGCAQLIEAPSVSERPVLSPEEEQAAMYNAEGEFINPYCRLSYAPRADPIVPEISNYKGYLAQAVLQRGPAVNSAVLSCIPAELQQHLNAYLTA